MVRLYDTNDKWKKGITMKVNSIGSIHHICIQTLDFEKAFKFYTEAIGLPVLREPFDFKGVRRLAWLDAGSIIIELNSLKRGTKDRACPYSSFGLGPSHIAFEVDDLDPVIERLRAHNVPIVKPPFLPPTGDPHQPRVAFVEGPDGDHIELRESPTTH